MHRLACTLSDAVVGTICERGSGAAKFFAVRRSPGLGGYLATRRHRGDVDGCQGQGGGQGGLGRN